jgi:hypothetical protein
VAVINPQGIEPDSPLTLGNSAAANVLVLLPGAPIRSSDDAIELIESRYENRWQRAAFRQT